MAAPLVQAELFGDVPQPRWMRRKGRSACGRDPAAGPGTCWHWWEGCPDPDRRGCYLHWRRTQAQPQPQPQTEEAA